MKQEIRQSKIRNQIELESRGIKYQLWRLGDTEEQKLRNNSLPIDDDYMFYIQLDWSDRESKDKLNLAEVFITLEWLFGKSSDFYDEGKGSFRFPVLLIIEKTNGTFYYLMVISDHRGTVYYRMYRIIENNIEGYDTQRTREPFELEFSRQEINYFLSYFQNDFLNLKLYSFQYKPEAKKQQPPKLVQKENNHHKNHLYERYKPHNKFLPLPNP